MAGILWLLYIKDSPNARSLVIRKYSEDLKDWIDRAEAIYSHFGAKKVGQVAEFHFPSGYKIITGHLKDANSYTKYQGHEYQRILIEELPQIPAEESYLKLISSCRSTLAGVKPMVFCTGNPGNVGQEWVKKRFIDPSPMGIPFERDGRSRVYIHATIDDNPSLSKADPSYVSWLEGLPDDLKRQWRWGDWATGSIKGAYFESDIKQADTENRIGNIIMWQYEPVYVAWDLGINDEQVGIFYQIKGAEIKVIDLVYGTNKGFDYYVFLLKERGYKYASMKLPHDGNKRAPDSLRSFAQVLKDEGYEVEVLIRTNDKNRDIQKAREIMPRCWFDAEKCTKLIEALRIYRRRWIEERGVFEDRPYHDWSSNFADAFQALATSLPTLKVKDDLLLAIQQYNLSSQNMEYEVLGDTMYETTNDQL